VQPGTLTCGAFGEDTVYYPIGGGQVNGTRGPLGSNFGSNALQSTIGHANYNALEAQRPPHQRTPRVLRRLHLRQIARSVLKHRRRSEPLQPRAQLCLSSFDVKQNFVLSYEYQLPFDRFLHPNRLTSGWSLSGITRFATGFPITMINNGDNSLIGTNPNGINNSSIDEPDYNGGPLHLNHNPRTNGNNYFNAAAFSMNALGTPGNAKRRFFYGPGADNYDMAVAKKLSLTESKSLLFRVEGFNVFNHTQFNGPAPSTATSAAPPSATRSAPRRPRILQGAPEVQLLAQQVQWQPDWPRAA
jgi:hypothetical protein